MQYIWINPVARAMYGYDAIRNLLKGKSYECIDAKQDWAGIVYRKYQKLVTDDKQKTVVDGRCPKAYRLVKDHFQISDLIYGDIHPILVHVAMELSERQEYLGSIKMITTPCESIANHGNSLQLKNTIFIPWNRFMEEQKLELTRKKIEKSPIPPGFFEGIAGRIDSVSEEMKIMNYFNQGKYHGASLVELLYCKEGCHNGDGV